MAEIIPPNVAKLVEFRAYLTATGLPATGKTIPITISKNGGASFSNPAAGATNATETASGFYKFTLGAGDTDTAGPLKWRGAEGTIHDVGDVYTVSAQSELVAAVLAAIVAILADPEDIALAVGTRQPGDGTYTYDQLIQVITAAVAGKLSGVGTGTLVFKSLTDDITVLTVTVDATGRTAVTVGSL